MIQLYVCVHAVQRVHTDVRGICCNHTQVGLLYTLSSLAVHGRYITIDESPRVKRTRG